MGRVSGKVALVTGAATGLGRATAVLLAQEGATVVVTDIDVENGRKTTTAINEQGATATFLPLDVADLEQWTAVVDAAVAEFGHLDITVNNAGICFAANVETTTLAQWRQTMAVNLDGVFFGTQQSIRVMKETGGGSIINISSIDGIIGEADLAAYCASKGGVRNFTKAAAVHCGERRYNIRVNSIHPGYVTTDMHVAYLKELGIYEEENEKVIARHPIGYLGEPNDVAYGVLYLASDESKFVTGSELVIDGGYLAQ